MSAYTLGLYLIAALIVVVTILPLWRTTRWWVRLCDFPRFQVAVLAIVLLALLTLASWPPSHFDLVVLFAVALSALWQLSWVWRFLPGAPIEVRKCGAPRGAPDRITLLTANVCQKKRDADGLLRIIRHVEPDLVLAVETDEWWCSALTEGLAARYPHRISNPLSNGYGVAMFSRFELVDPAIRYLVDDAIPSIKTSLRLRTGAVIDFYGVHPQPPAPFQDSTERDVELVAIGREIERAQRPAIVLGDLNDVAWSPTTSQFKQIGGLLDPRRGRGFFATYPARLPGLRYPLDHIFHTHHFAICEMQVLDDFNSDHLPLVATLSLAGAANRA